MTVLVIADEIRRKEFTEKVQAATGFKLSYCKVDENIDVNTLQQFEVIVDLNFNGDSNAIATYTALQNRVVLLNAVTTNLNTYFELIDRSSSCFIGINALPSFLSLAKAEICLPKATDLKVASLFFKQLNWEFEVVPCRVGMITPRIICMIINEACYTLQEGTSTKEAIDLAMKLGTNYPFGPFEWATKIGLTAVYETLTALYEDTHEERYKVCPLLKTHHLRQASF
jgi:3-hydroxybutyryl-CoA dehydrogenase